MASGALTLVGCLGPYHNVRLVFGYHSGPKLIKWHVLHSAIIIIIIICCIYFTNPSPLPIGIAMEYVFYILTSIIIQDKHLRQFYQRIPAIDSLPHATAIYRNIRKRQIIAVIVWATYRSLSSLAGVIQSIFNRVFWTKDNVGRLLMLFSSLGVDVNQMTTVMIFYLLYVRVVIIRKTIESNGFDKNPIMAFSSRRYIQMYELLLYSLYKNELTVKVMTAIFLCTTTYRLQLLIFIIISLLNAVRLTYIPLIRMLSLTMPYIPFIYSVVLLDLARDELARTNVLTIQAYIKCKDERTRSEIRQLRTVLETHPLQYTLWRTVPLSLYVVLSTLSFWIITAMGIMQMSFR